MFDIVENFSTPDTKTAGFLFPPDQSMATYGGLAVGAATLAGSSAVGTMVIPGQVFGGLLISGALCTAGAVKTQTGSYFPFLGNKDKSSTETTPAAVAATQPAAVVDRDGNELEIEDI